MKGLPLPKWLTLEEALAQLVERGHPQEIAKNALARAFGDRAIETRGRIYGKFGDKVWLSEAVWDGASINWNASRLEGRKGPVFDIEVRTETLLFWIDPPQWSPQQSEGELDLPPRGRKSDSEKQGKSIPLALLEQMNDRRALSFERGGLRQAAKSMVEATGLKLNSIEREIRPRFKELQKRAMKEENS